jgi:glycosyltransferase involved in cell wall biosynthesis
LTSITIVTPTLNAAQYLRDCLSSVAAQDCEHVEHLIVDGGSVDATQSIAESSHATYLELHGGGQAAAVNAGVREARNPIVGWLNADDIYQPGALQHVLELFHAEPELDMVYGDCLVIDAMCRPLWLIQPGDYDFDRLLRRGNYLAQPSVFFRRRVFEEVGYLDESLHFGMDYELWLRLRDVPKVYTPRVLAAFRWHEQSKTAQNLGANWSELLAIVRRYGGSWTPALVWSYARARVTAARLDVKSKLHA